MLNEIKEYEFYLTRGYGDIIRSKNLKDSLSGIRAILVALARGFIGDCKNEGIFDTEKLHFYTIAFLKVWLVGIEAAIENAANKNDQMLGNTLKEIESYKILSERLKKADAENLLGYMNREKININGKNNTDQTRRGFLFFKLNDWSNPLFPEADNSLNAIRFEAIVADAIFKGELKNSLLRIRETDKSNHGMEGDFGDSRMWVVLGIVALFLQRKPQYCQSGVITWAELSNSLKKVGNSRGKTPYDSIASLVKKAGYTYKGEPLFGVHEVAKNCIKLRVNEEWLRDYEVELVPVNCKRDIRYNLYGDEDFWNPKKRGKSPKGKSNIRTMKKPYMMKMAEEFEL